jgi:hypothetical protein
MQAELRALTPQGMGYAPVALSLAALSVRAAVQAAAIPPFPSGTGMEPPRSRPVHSHHRCTGHPMSRNNMNSNQLPEWQACYRERHRARIQFQARLAYLPKPILSTSLRFTPNVTRADRPAPPPNWNSGGGDWSCN